MHKNKGIPTFSEFVEEAKNNKSQVESINGILKVNFVKFPKSPAKIIVFESLDEFNSHETLTSKVMQVLNHLTKDKT